LELLEAELAQRVARAEQEAGRDEHEREQLLDRLQEMAQRLAAAASPLRPLRVDDMSPAERLSPATCCRSICGRRDWERRMKSGPSISDGEAAEAAAPKKSHVTNLLALRQ
jgi:hypothetical protein